MPLDINGTILTGGTTLTATDASNNRLFSQNANGATTLPQTAAGATLVPMFNVGTGTTLAWVPINGVVTHTYTGGNGYYNIGASYSTSTGRFTAPWTGLYLFQWTAYVIGLQDGLAAISYGRPQFMVNGSITTRRPGGPVVRIRQYGLWNHYAHDADCCELIYLTAGDYVQPYLEGVNTFYYYDAYGCWSGAYMGS